MRDDDEFWADDPYIDEDEDDPEAYETLGLLAGDYAEDGEVNVFGVFDFDMLDIEPDMTLPF